MNKHTMGTIIASKRKALGMTQLDLANQIGVTDKAVSKWERNISCPDVSSLPKLAEILGVSVDDLMQVEHLSGKKNPAQSAMAIASLAVRALCLAMGVAVAVLSILDELSSQSAMIMLGIGLACAGIGLMEKGAAKADASH